MKLEWRDQTFLVVNVKKLLGKIMQGKRESNREQVSQD